MKWGDNDWPHTDLSSLHLPPLTTAEQQNSHSNHSDAALIKEKNHFGYGRSESQLAYAASALTVTKTFLTCG